MNLFRVFMLLVLFIKNSNGFKSPFHIARKSISTLYMKRKQESSFNLYAPKSENQKTYVSYLQDEKYKLLVSLGPAGTGKTLFACQKAITQLKSDKINKIIITRPVVSVEEDIGFLPGNLVKKMDPWTKPIFDIFLDYLSKTELDNMLYINKIEICPLAYMRGRTFKHSFIIADEMQNSSPNQMKMLLTRLGDNSRLIITGDLYQSDLKVENGLQDFMNKFTIYNQVNNNTNIGIVNFANDDIERSEIVKQIIGIYDYSKNVKNETVIATKNETVLAVKNETVIAAKNETVIAAKNETVTNKNLTKKYKIMENDAALIPKHHISYNYDIFFDGRDF